MPPTSAEPIKLEEAVWAFQELAALRAKCAETSEEENRLSDRVKASGYSPATDLSGIMGTSGLFFFDEFVDKFVTNPGALFRSGDEVPGDIRLPNGIMPFHRFEKAGLREGATMTSNFDNKTVTFSLDGGEEITLRVSLSEDGWEYVAPENSTKFDLRPYVDAEKSDWGAGGVWALVKASTISEHSYLIARIPKQGEVCQPKADDVIAGMLADMKFGEENDTVMGGAEFRLEDFHTQAMCIGYTVEQIDLHKDSLLAGVAIVFAMSPDYHYYTTL